MQEGSRLRKKELLNLYAREEQRGVSFWFGNQFSNVLKQTKKIGIWNEKERGRPEAAGWPLKEKKSNPKGQTEVGRVETKRRGLVVYDGVEDKVLLIGRGCN